MMDERLAPATVVARRQQLAAFKRFCLSNRKEPFPVAPETFLLFLAKVAERTSGKFVLTHANLIRRWHEDQGVDYLEDPQIEMAIRAIVRTSKGGVGRPMQYISHEIFKDLIDSLGNRMSDRRDRAMFLVMYGAMMHASDLSTIDEADVYNQQGGIVLVVRSAVPRYGLLARMPDSPYCPVRALNEWMSCRPPEVAWVFPRILKSGACGERLNPKGITRIVQERLRVIGIEGRSLGGGALRFGAIDRAFDLDIDPNRIAKHAGIHQPIAFEERWHRIRKVLHPFCAEDFGSQRTIVPDGRPGRVDRLKWD